MKAKDKAEELIKKFTNYYGLDSDLVNDEKAIQCALICVDEIIEVCNVLEPWLGLEYWEKVKQEILNRQ